MSILQALNDKTPSGGFLATAFLSGRALTEQQENMSDGDV
jgi:hypothetical protein